MKIRRLWLLPGPAASGFEEFCLRPLILRPPGSPSRWSSAGRGRTELEVSSSRPAPNSKLASRHKAKALDRWVNEGGATEGKTGNAGRDKSRAGEDRKGSRTLKSAQRDRKSIRSNASVFFASGRIWREH